MTTEENFVDFSCPYCSQPVSFPSSAAGVTQECPNCMESVVVPQTGNEVGRKPPLPFVTSRLRLRRFVPGDWKALLDLASDEVDFASVEGLPGGTEEQVLYWLESDQHIKLTTPNQMFHLAVELQDGGKLIGYVGLVFTDLHRMQVAFTIGMHRDFRRQGFAREAVSGLLGFCFEGIGLHRVSAHCDGHNTAACRLLERAGLRREGEFVKDQPTSDGGWSNSVWYAILEEEFKGAGVPSAEAPL